jgi:hypothetical protein
LSKTAKILEVIGVLLGLFSTVAFYLNNRNLGIWLVILAVVAAEIGLGIWLTTGAPEPSKASPSPTAGAPAFKGGANNSGNQVQISGSTINGPIFFDNNAPPASNPQPQEAFSEERTVYSIFVGDNQCQMNTSGRSFPVLSISRSSDGLGIQYGGADVTDDTLVSGQVRDGKFLIDAKIYPGQGLPIRLISRSFSNIPDRWDYNSSADATEVVNADRRPVFQLAYTHDGGIVRISGIFSNGREVVVVTPGVNQLFPNDTGISCDLNPIFRYPSWRFRGVDSGEEDSLGKDGGGPRGGAGGGGSITFFGLPPDTRPPGPPRMISAKHREEFANALRPFADRIKISLMIESREAEALDFFGEMREIFKAAGLHGGIGERAVFAEQPRSVYGVEIKVKDPNNPPPIVPVILKELSKCGIEASIAAPGPFDIPLDDIPVEVWIPRTPLKSQ